MPFITHLQHPKRRTLRPHALLAILLLTTAAHAQEPNPTDLPGTRRITPGALRIVVLEGHNVRNSLPSRSAVSPVVQVFDFLEQPVEGAEVTFEVLPTGPGGTFANGQNITTTRTDARGQATAVFTPNTLPGTFSIKVTASAGGQSGEARIQQTNDANATFAGPIPPPRPWYKSWKRWALIGAGAGGAVAAVVILTRSDPTVTISPGTVILGGPR